MQKQRLSIILRSVACGVVGMLVSSVSAQEPGELLIPAKNDFGVSETAAERSTAEVAVSDANGDDFETLTRGPLHEAFAEPIVSDPEPGLVVSQEPPALINELPPEFRPEGEDAIWIAGYWGWDDQREDFIWISGVYRVPPDGHQWVPGYWHPVSNGWQWVQGFWVEDEAESVAYLPLPPKTLEFGPSSPSPGVNYFYIPGNWSHASTSSYQWTAGYWHPMQDDLIWIPAHVVWTPRGCIFVDGYWDRRLPMRGICFAPVSIPRSTYSRPGWCLRPNVVLDSQVVLHNLFVQPRYNHYVFGDYYGLPSGHRGVVPAYVYHQSRGSCDPLISFYSAYNARQGQDMIRWYGNQHADLSRNPSKRPPQIWSSTHVGKEPEKRHSHMAYSLDQFAKLDGVPKISPITAGLQQEILQRDLDRKRFSQDRKSIEQNGKMPLAIPNGIANGAINTVVNPITLALPKLEPVIRKNDGSAKIGNMPVPPRSPGRAQANAELQRGKERMTKPANPSQLPRGLDSIPNISMPNKVEPSKLDVPRQGDTNRILKSTEINRPLDRANPSGLDRMLTPKIQSQLPKVPFQQPSHEARRSNGQSQFPNVESRLPSVRLPQQNQLQPSNLQSSNADRQKSMRGMNPMGGPLGQVKNGLPLQPAVPPVSPSTKLKLPDNNANSPRSIPSLDRPLFDRQPRPGNPPPNGIGGSNKGR